MKIVTLKAGKLKKNKYYLDNKLYFQWIQLIHAIPLIWKQKIAKRMLKQICCTRLSSNKNTRAIVLPKLTAREFYSVLLLSSGKIPTSQKYYDKVFSNENLNWKKFIYYQV